MLATADSVIVNAGLTCVPFSFNEDAIGHAIALVASLPEYWILLGLDIRYYIRYQRQR